MNLETLIANREGTIIDVRTREEFMGGHVVGSINIPLSEIPEKIQELKSMNSPLILCCASGGRSGQACGFLSSQGISCINAGAWTNVNYYQSLH
jgi:rhodanese-related sulfurtransferase